MDQVSAKTHDTWQTRWSADRVEKLRELWPIMSASQIGRAMGKSRMAIIGKAHRLALPLKKLDRLLRPKRGGQPRKPVYVTVPRPSAPLAPEPILSDIPVPEFLNRTIDELGTAECHYPHGDRAPYRFCGQPCDRTTCYCAYHHRLTNHEISPTRREFEWVR